MLKEYQRGTNFCVKLFFAMVSLLFTVPVWGANGVGTGTLTISDDGLCNGSGFDCRVDPHHWDVFPGETVHINISPSFSICTAGGTSKIDDRCSSNADCTSTGNCVGPPGERSCNNASDGACGTAGCCTTNSQCTVAGTCTSGVLECEGDTTVIVKTHNGTACTQDSDCAGAPSEPECDTDLGYCTFHDIIATSGRVGSGDIDVCWNVPSDMCIGGVVAYCDEVGLIANANHPVGTDTFSAANVRPVDANALEGSNCDDPAGEPRHEPIVQCGQVDAATCSNEVGSFCCGLTQGAYGAPKSVATNLGNNNCSDPMNMGFIPAALCEGCDVFAGDPNGTTIGIHGTRAVTVNNLTTLQAYLPAGGTPAKFKTSLVGSDTHYATPSSIPDRTKMSTDITGGSKGQGGGSLSGQTMACELNGFLSDCTPPWGGSGTFTASGFGGFTLPDAGVLLCTKRSGGDKVLGTGDDVCQAFSYPTCVAGLTVAQVHACANAQLATGSNSCGCSPSNLNNSLNNINVEFDQCGNVIDCGGVVTAGVFGCP